MSIQLVAWVMDHSSTEGTDRLVLLSLANNTRRDENECWPGTATIAAEANVDERTARRALERLVQDGHVIKHEPGGGRGRKARYEIVTDEPKPGRSAPLSGTLPPHGEHSPIEPGGHPESTPEASGEPAAASSGLTRDHSTGTGSEQHEKPGRSAPLSGAVNPGTTAPLSGDLNVGETWAKGGRNPGAGGAHKEEPKPKPQPTTTPQPPAGSAGRGLDDPHHGQHPNCRSCATNPRATADTQLAADTRRRAEASARSLGEVIAAAGADLDDVAQRCEHAWPGDTGLADVAAAAWRAWHDTNPDAVVPAPPTQIPAGATRAGTDTGGLHRAHHPQSQDHHPEPEARPQPRPGDRQDPGEGQDPGDRQDPGG